MAWRVAAMGVVVWMASVAAGAAPPATERRVLLLGFKGNAPKDVRASVSGAVRQGYLEALPKGYKTLDCAEIYSTLVGLGQDPEACEQGKLGSDDVALFSPRYVVAGEVMNVGGSYYVTVKLLDGNSVMLDSVTSHHAKMGDLLGALRRDVRQAMATRVAQDAGGLSSTPTVVSVAQPERPAPATVPPPRQPQNQAGALSAEPPPPGPPVVAARAPLERQPPVPRTPVTVALVVTERPVNAQKFVWSGPNVWALAPAREQLSGQGMDVVDGVSSLGALAPKLTEDGTVSKTMAQQLFVNGAPRQAICLRLVYTDAAVTPGNRELAVSLQARVFDPPAQGVLRDHMEQERTVTCPEADPSECRRKVLEEMVKPTLTTLLRANPVK